MSADGEDLEVLGRECPACGDPYAAHSQGLAWCTESLYQVAEKMHDATEDMRPAS